MERGKREGTNMLVCAHVHLCVPTCVCVLCVFMYPHMLDVTSLGALSSMLPAQST